jgi:hypothetical protein
MPRMARVQRLKLAALTLALAGITALIGSTAAPAALASQATAVQVGSHAAAAQAHSVAVPDETLGPFGEISYDDNGNLMCTKGAHGDPVEFMFNPAAGYTCDWYWVSIGDSEFDIEPYTNRSDVMVVDVATGKLSIEGTGGSNTYWGHVRNGTTMDYYIVNYGDGSKVADDPGAIGTTHQGQVVNAGAFGNNGYSIYQVGG